LGIEQATGTTQTRPDRTLRRITTKP
jgi:hypothetical protein